MQGRITGAALAAAACAAAPQAAAMDNPARQRVETLNLDLVPRGSRRPEERGTYLYGRVDLGLLARRPAGPCSPGADWSQAELSRSFLGLAGRETLDRGYEAYVRLEHSLAGAAAGCAPQAPFWDGAAYIGWGRRDLGWLEAGRQPQAAHAVATLADPWDGDATVAAVAGHLYRRTSGHEDTRSDRTLGWRSPQREATRWQVQASLRPGSAPAGAAFMTDIDTWRLGLGLQRWAGGDWTLPLAARQVLGDWTWGVAVARGQRDGRMHTGWLVGAEHAVPTGPRRATLRLAAAESRVAGQAAERQFSAGVEWRLSSATALHGETALRAAENGATRLSAGLGLRHRFDLR